jgi:hypothetical protein
MPPPARASAPYINRPAKTFRARTSPSSLQSEGTLDQDTGLAADPDGSGLIVATDE